MYDFHGFWSYLTMSKNIPIHCLKFFLTPGKNETQIMKITCSDIDEITLHKKEVCAQLLALEKCFKICYVYVKRKPV